MKNRKTAAALLCLLLVMALCGCGEKSQEIQSVESSAVPEMSSTLPDTGLHKAEEEASPADAAAPAEAEDSSEDEALLALALRFVDKPVEDLYAALGEPAGADYAPSCLGSGEDGELYYEGFTVYTYRDGSGEVVTDVQ